MKPFYSESGIVIYNADCRDVLPQLEPVEHVITDPPYSEHVHANGMSGGSGGNRNYSRPRKIEYGFSHITTEEITGFSTLISQSATRWTLIFSDVELSNYWRTALIDNGLNYIRTGVWIKHAAAPQFSGDRPAAGFDAITILHPRKKMRWNGGGSPAVWSHQIVKGGACETEARVHPAQKPLSLMKELIALFTDPGDIILDPFMGSGTTLVAAKNLGRKAVGIEINEAYCRVAVERLRQNAFDFSTKQIV